MRAAPPLRGESAVPQRTIRQPATLSGIGIHTGAPAAVTCRPAPLASGLVFVRDDLPARPTIRAAVDQVSDTRRSVTLGRGVTVQTVEHLLAAAAALGITNLEIETRGGELPILDGSAAPYLAALLAAGIVEQPADAPTIHLRAPVWIAHRSGWVLAVPAPRLRVTYIVPTGHPVLGTQVVEFSPHRDDFATAIAPARTWGFANDLDTLRAAGLARGASPENALGIGPDGYLAPPRYADEPARHKVLDLIGDLALVGRPLRAYVVACGAGHGLHVELAKRISATV